MGSLTFDRTFMQMNTDYLRQTSTVSRLMFRAQIAEEYLTKA